jgi:RNA polymerase sigma factor (sigma-70 family)
MPSSGDVTRWIRRLQAGEREVIQGLWERYYRAVIAMARRRLGDLPRRAADEEDVALSAFDSFCRAAEQGRFPRLEDRGDLWQILLLLTARKAADLVEHEGRGKRDWHRVEGRAEEDGRQLREMVGREPDPAFAAQVAEECRRLLTKLGDEQLRLLVLRKMEGYTNEEVAVQLGCAPATVERRLRLIRKRWENEIGSAG